MNTFQLTIPDMACSACAETITKAVLGKDTKATVKANLETKQVEVVTAVTVGEISTAIADAGYTVN